jgi:DNA-binding transcriptional LysR family regulator
MATLPNASLNWSLDLLRTFVVFARAGSLKLAADQLRITESAISQQLKRLNDTSPVPLFVQFGKKKTLTPYGHSLAATLQPLLESVNAAVTSVNLIHSDPSQALLRIGCRRELVTQVDTLSAFRGRVEYVLGGKKEIEARLAARTVDIAIVRDRPELEGVISSIWHETSAVLAVSKVVATELDLNRDSIMLPKKILSLLRSSPAIAYLPQLPLLGDWLRNCKVPLEQLNISRKVEDWRAIATLVLAGKGFTVMPRDIAIDVFGKTSRITQIPLSPDVVPATKFFAACHADVRKSPSIEAFLTRSASSNLR